MTDAVSVAGPVTIKNDSSARVAFELMTYIGGKEHDSNDNRRDRDYWLRLYCQCYLAAKGADVEYAVKRR